MKRFVAFLLPFMIAFAALAPAGSAQVLLNEILADPASDWDNDGSVSSKLDEWVEVINTGGDRGRPRGLPAVGHLGGDELSLCPVGDAGAGATRLILGTEVVAWQNANGVSAFGLSLNNGGDTVYLYRIAGADTTAIDSYGYVTSQVADDRSVGRLPDGAANLGDI